MNKKFFVFTFASLVLLFASPAARAENGVTDSNILIGQSIDLSSESKGRPMSVRKGAMLYLDEVNAKGGVNGRKIELLTLDDAYDPKRTVENTRALINDKKVFALFEYFGTPLIKAAMYDIEKAKIPLLTPTSGADFLRKPVKPQVFNLSASNEEKALGTIRFLKEKWGINKFAIFYQDDELGVGGRKSAIDAILTVGASKVAEGKYHRGEHDYDVAFEDIRKGNPDAVIMWSSAQVTASFLEKCKKANFRPVFVMSSVANGPELRSKLPGLSDMTITMVQSVPFMGLEDRPIVQSFLKAAKASGMEANEVEYEGYLNANFLVASLQRAGRDLTRKALVDAIEGMKDFDLGGIPLTFSPTNHQGIAKIQLLQAEKDKFVLASENPPSSVKAALKTELKSR